MKSEIRYCDDIGCFSIDRPRTSCRHATSFCAKHCYNVKLERLFNLSPKDQRNAEYWENIDGREVRETLDRKRNQTKRVRLMTRGEAFSTPCDVERVKDLLTANKNRLFWIPTRAWRDATMRDLIEREIMPLKNARIQASLDPSNSEEEKAEIIGRGWSTMFFGDDSATAGRSLCPKTWKGKKGACSTCRGACFSPKQTHVHLKKH